MVNDKEFLVVISVDTDSDELFGNRHPNKKQNDKKIRGWQGLAEGKDIIVEGLNKAASEFSLAIPVTWFIRCDFQLQLQYGSYTYLLSRFESFWNSRRESGDDLQWHPHLNCLENGVWIQNTDTLSIKEDIYRGFESYKNMVGAPSAIRIGGAYHSNEIMSSISSLGLLCDSSALPGRKRQDGEKLIDWEISPNKPYRPSRDDYRIPGDNSHKIWEIPMNTIETKVSYDKSPILRYINLAFNPGVLDKGLEPYIANNDVLVSITHPFELIPSFFSDSALSSHPLLSFSAASFHHNLKKIIEATRRASKKIKFLTISQLLNDLQISSCKTG